MIRALTNVKRFRLPCGPAVCVAVVMGAFLVASSKVLALTSIIIGTVSVPAGQAAVQVPIYVSGGGAVTDLVGYFQIGDGGPLFGGTAGPKITQVLFSGSIWNTAPGGFSWSATFTDPDGNPATANGTPTQLEELFVSLNTAGQTVATSGLLCTLVIDTRGYTGDFPLKMVDLYPPANTTDTEFANGVTPVPATIVNGTLHLTNLVPVLPALIIENHTAGTRRVRFPSQAGVSYTLQWNSGLDAGGWTNITPTVAGDGSEKSWVDDGSQTGTLPSLASRRFYRLLIP